MQKLFEESLEEVHKGWLENKWKIERIYEQGFIGGCAEYFQKVLDGHLKSENLGK